MLKVFFSEVGRFSRLSSVLYIVLHDSEQIEVGGVTGTFLQYFLPILGNTRKNAIILEKVKFYIELIVKRIKWKEMVPTGVKKVRDLFYFCLIPMRKEYHFLIYS